VAFTAPVSDGGSAITGYTVTSSPGGITATGTASPLTVTGLPMQLLILLQYLPQMPMVIVQQALLQIQ